MRGDRKHRSVVKVWVPELTKDAADALLGMFEDAGIPVASYTETDDKKLLFCLVPRAGVSVLTGGESEVEIGALGDDAKKIVVTLVKAGVTAPEFSKRGVTR